MKTERVNFVEVAYINLFVPNVPFLYPLKTSENLTVKNGCIGNEWVKLTSSISNWVFMSLIKYGQLRGNPPKVFLEKSFMKIYSKFTGEHPCQRVISIKLLYNFTEITLRHGCSPVNLYHIFRTTITKNTSGELVQEHKPTNTFTSKDFLDEDFRWCICWFIPNICLFITV